MRILLVEDEPRVARFVAKGLREKSYAVDIATDGESALYQTEINDYDLIILDVMLPGKDGFEICRELRGRCVNTPVLMLTARDAIDDRVEGLDSGADDYLIKPFDFDELLARIRALLRRTQPQDDEELICGDLRLHTGTRDLYRGERRIEITTREYELLLLFLHHPRRVLTREQILDRVWGTRDVDSNAIEVHIGRLRDKLEAYGEPRLIQTVRGAGYTLREDER